MASFVIVHGAWGGGWEWRAVADELEARGHRAATPTLTGMGEPPERLARTIGLRTHADDVARAVRIEQDPVVLVAHSYGGMPTTMAAGSVLERVTCLIYVDAFVPTDGQRETDLIDPEWTRTMMEEPARDRGAGWLVPFPFPDDLDDVPEEMAERYRRSWQPIATFTDPAEVDPRVAEVPSAFVHCVGKPPGTDGFVDIAERARGRGWTVVDVDSGHDVQIEQPIPIASILDDLASRMAAAGGAVTH